MANTTIEWTDRTGRALGALKSAAKRIGLSFGEYCTRLDCGQRWCTRCKDWHPLGAFGVDTARGFGAAAICLASRRVKSCAAKPRRGFRGWRVPARDGDKRQARRRVNYLVEQGIIPRPGDLGCIDCADSVFTGTYRHEYDHAKGYGAEHQLYVEPVCSRCHHAREETRRGR